MDNNEYTVDNTMFIGREKETQHLQELFFDAVLSPKSEIRRVIIITGEPMVGKTRLSKEIGNRLVSDFQLLDKQLDVYCIKLRQVTDFNRVLVKISAALGLPPCSENALIKHFMRLKRLCLLIFDSAEHLSVDTSNELQTQFLDFCTRLVNNSKVLLLINSRFKYRLLSIHVNVYHHRLKPLSIEDSIKLLTSVAENVVFVDGIDKKISKYCAGIPHALVIAATELKNNTYTPHELFALLEENRLETLSSANYSETEKVSVVIKSSVNKLKSIRNDYIRLSYIPSSFTAKAVADILELSNEKPVVSAKQRVLIPLTTRSLVARDTLNDRFDIHDFLREFLSNELSLLSSEQSIVLRNRYCSFYGKLLQSLAPIVEEDSCKKLPLFSIELINIQKLLQEAALCPSEDYDLFLDVACKAEYLIINFLPRKESVEFYAACVRAAESRNQKKHLGVMLSSYGQALNFTASNWKLAQEQYKKAVDILASYGDTVDMAWLLNHIGWNLLMQGSSKVALRYFKDAEETLLRMSEIERKLETRWERIIAAVWSCIGISYVVLDSPKRGIRYHEKTLKMRRKLWGDHPSIGGTYNNMSLAYMRMGDQNKAIEYCQKGLDTKMRFNHEPANDIIVSLNNVAINTCFYEDNPNKAHRLLNQSFEMRESLGLNHVDTALIANNRGRVYEYQKNYSEAMVCYQQAVHIREKLQPQHKSTANSLFYLASLKLKFNQLEDALELFYKCYEIRKSGIPQNTELGEIMESLGTVHEKRNEFSDAHKYFMEALEEFNRLKAFFEIQDNDSKAKEMGKNVERIRRKLQDLPFTAINNLDSDVDENSDNENGGDDSVQVFNGSSIIQEGQVNQSHSDRRQIRRPKNEGKNEQTQDATKLNYFVNTNVCNTDTGESDRVFKGSTFLRSMKLCSQDLEERQHKDGPPGQDTIIGPMTPESAYVSGGVSLSSFCQLPKETEVSLYAINEGFNEDHLDRIIKNKIRPFLNRAKGKNLTSIEIKIKFDTEDTTQLDSHSDLTARSAEERMVLHINENEKPVQILKIVESTTQTCNPTLLPDNQVEEEDLHGVAKSNTHTQHNRIYRQACIEECLTMATPMLPSGRIMRREEFEQIKQEAIGIQNNNEHLDYNCENEIQNNLNYCCTSKSLGSSNKSTLDSIHINEKYNYFVNKTSTETTDASIKECNKWFTKTSICQGSGKIISFDEFKHFPRNQAVYFNDDVLLLSDKQQRDSQIVVDMILDNTFPHSPTSTTNTYTTSSTFDTTSDTRSKSFNLKGKQ